MAGQGLLNGRLLQSAAVDRTVCYSGLYSPLPQTVIIFRLKDLDRP